MRQRLGGMIRDIKTSFWAHPEGDDDLVSLKKKLEDRGYEILKVGVCPANGRKGIKIAEWD